jgi:hypothetical protein
LRILHCPGILKLSPELLQIHTMLCYFPLPDKDYRNIQPIALLQDRIGIYIDFSESGPKFSQERNDGSLGFVAEVTSGTRVEGNVTVP